MAQNTFDSGPTKARPHEILIVLSYIIIPWLGLLVGAYLLCLQLFGGVQAVSAKDLWLLVGGYIVTIEGISLAAHRGLTHPTYNTHIWVKWLLYIAAAMAFQGRLLRWRHDHLEHHEHAEVPCTSQRTACDPHTPRNGFWHSFVGWLIRPLTTPGPQAIADEQLLLAKMLQQQDRLDPHKIVTQKTVVENVTLAWKIDQHLVWWGALGLLIPTLIGGWSSAGWSWPTALTGLLWGGLIRICLVNTMTSLVNSYCHKPGWLGNYRHVVTNDDSRNGWLFALFNPEWPHANHHLFPDSANQGIYWYERLFDYSAHILWVGEKLHLFWAINWKCPADLREAKRKIEMGREKRQKLAIT